MDSCEKANVTKMTAELKEISNRNVPYAVVMREYGTSRCLNQLASEFQVAAEEHLVMKEHTEMKCNLPHFTRSTYLMVFSPDGKKMASSHGNHNVYVTDVKSGKNLNTLTGHPRTPWCIAFHPSSNQILASGCLGGQVRVWDLHGGSEIWTIEGQLSIASLAFHPSDRLLVIASYNEIYFWDWRQSEPFAKCSTLNEKEKIRYVAFDYSGSKFVTGTEIPRPIQSQWDRIGSIGPPNRPYCTISARPSAQRPGFGPLFSRQEQVSGSSSSSGHTSALGSPSSVSPLSVSPLRASSSNEERGIRQNVQPLQRLLDSRIHPFRRLHVRYDNRISNLNESQGIIGERNPVSQQNIDNIEYPAAEPTSTLLTDLPAETLGGTKVINQPSHQVCKGSPSSDRVAPTGSTPCKIPTSPQISCTLSSPSVIDSCSGGGDTREINCVAHSALKTSDHLDCSFTGVLQREENVRIFPDRGLSSEGLRNEETTIPSFSRSINTEDQKCAQAQSSSLPRNIRFIMRQVCERVQLHLASLSELLSNMQYCSVCLPRIDHTHVLRILLLWPGLREQIRSLQPIVSRNINFSSDAWHRSYQEAIRSISSMEFRPSSIANRVSGDSRSESNLSFTSGCGHFENMSSRTEQTNDLSLIPIEQTDPATLARGLSVNFSTSTRASDNVSPTRNRISTNRSNVVPTRPSSRASQRTKMLTNLMRRTLNLRSQNAIRRRLGSTADALRVQRTFHIRPVLPANVEDEETSLRTMNVESPDQLSILRIHLPQRPSAFTQPEEARASALQGSLCDSREERNSRRRNDASRTFRSLSFRRPFPTQLQHNTSPRSHESRRGVFEISVDPSTSRSSQQLTRSARISNEASVLNADMLMRIFPSLRRATSLTEHSEAALAHNDQSSNMRAQGQNVQEVVEEQRPLVVNNTCIDTNGNTPSPAFPLLTRSRLLTSTLQQRDLPPPLAGQMLTRSPSSAVLGHKPPSVHPSSKRPASSFPPHSERSRPFLTTLKANLAPQPHLTQNNYAVQPHDPGTRVATPPQLPPLATSSSSSPALPTLASISAFVPSSPLPLPQRHEAQSSTQTTALDSNISTLRTSHDVVEPIPSITTQSPPSNARHKSDQHADNKHSALHQRSDDPLETNLTRLTSISHEGEVSSGSSIIPSNFGGIDEHLSSCGNKIRGATEERRTSESETKTMTRHLLERRAKHYTDVKTSDCPKVRRTENSMDPKQSLPKKDTVSEAGPSHRVCVQRNKFSCHSESCEGEKIQKYKEENESGGVFPKPCRSHVATGRESNIGPKSTFKIPCSTAKETQKDSGGGNHLGAVNPDSEPGQQTQEPGDRGSCQADPILRLLPEPTFTLQLERITSRLSHLLSLQEDSLNSARINRNDASHVNTPSGTSGYTSSTSQEINRSSDALTTSSHLLSRLTESILHQIRIVQNVRRRQDNCSEHQDMQSQPGLGAQENSPSDVAYIRHRGQELLRLMTDTMSTFTSLFGLSDDLQRNPANDLEQTMLTAFWLLQGLYLLLHTSLELSYLLFSYFILSCEPISPAGNSNVSAIERILRLNTPFSSESPAPWLFASSQSSAARDLMRTFMLQQTGGQNVVQLPIMSITSENPQLNSEMTVNSPNQESIYGANPLDLPSAFRIRRERMRRRELMGFNQRELRSQYLRRPVQQSSASADADVAAQQSIFFYFDFTRNEGEVVREPYCTPEEHRVHRIQLWNFSKGDIPDITDGDANLVVGECKIHNDASVDISGDGRLLVALLPPLRTSVHPSLPSSPRGQTVGVYSMVWDSLGQLLYTTSLDRPAVSVALSPTAAYLLVGLAARRSILMPSEQHVIAQAFRLEGAKPGRPFGARGRLNLHRRIEAQNAPHGINCVRWAPVSGHGMVYGTNTGALVMLR